MYINRQTLWAKKKVTKIQKREILVLNDILSTYSS